MNTDGVFRDPNLMKLEIESLKNDLLVLSKENEKLRAKLEGRSTLNKIPALKGDFADPVKVVLAIFALISASVGFIAFLDSGLNVLFLRCAAAVFILFLCSILLFFRGFQRLD